MKPDKYQNLEKIDQDTNIDIEMPRIKKKFELSDRIKMGLNFMRDKKKTAIDELKQKQTLFKLDDVLESFEEEKKQKIPDCGLKLTVHGTGILEMDQYVLHPFVRIHVIDIGTKKYLAKNGKSSVPGVAQNEHISFRRINQD